MIGDDIVDVTITPTSESIVAAKATKKEGKKNISWTETMEVELVKAILKNKAHVTTVIDKNVKWEKVFLAVKELPVFIAVISQHEVILYILVVDANINFC